MSKTYIGVIISDNDLYIGKKPTQPEIGSLVFIQEFNETYYRMDDGWMGEKNYGWYPPKECIEIIEEVNHE